MRIGIMRHFVQYSSAHKRWTDGEILGEAPRSTVLFYLTTDVNSFLTAIDNTKNLFDAVIPGHYRRSRIFSDSHNRAAHAAHSRRRRRQLGAYRDKNPAR